MIRRTTDQPASSITAGVGGCQAGHEVDDVRARLAANHTPTPSNACSTCAAVFGSSSTEGLSQEELALEAGLDRSYFGGVERGDPSREGNRIAQAQNPGKIREKSESATHLRRGFSIGDRSATTTLCRRCRARHAMPCRALPSRAVPFHAGHALPRRTAPTHAMPAAPCRPLPSRAPPRLAPPSHARLATPRRASPRLAGPYLALPAAPSRAVPCRAVPTLAFPRPDRHEPNAHRPIPDRSSGHRW